MCGRAGDLTTPSASCLNSPIDGPYGSRCADRDGGGELDDQRQGVDDLPRVTRSVPSRRTAYQRVLLSLSDFERNQVLAGYVTYSQRRATIGRRRGLAHRDHGGVQRLRCGHTRLAPVHLTCVKRLDLLGVDPPYAGYHPLGILGPPDCGSNLGNTECTMDQPWVADGEL